eukprot:5680573-Alexandrium_andersonii.AAC.1
MLAGLRSAGIATPADPWATGQALALLRHAAQVRPLEHHWRREVPLQEADETIETARDSLAMDE